MIAAHGLERFVSEVIIEGSLEETTSHMGSRMTGHMTVIARVSGRRFWTIEQKLLMLRDAFGYGGDGLSSHVPATISIFSLVRHWHDQSVAGVRGHRYEEGY